MAVVAPVTLTVALVLVSVMAMPVEADELKDVAVVSEIETEPLLLLAVREVVSNKPVAVTPVLPLRVMELANPEGPV